MNWSLAKLLNKVKLWFHKHILYFLNKIFSLTISLRISSMHTRRTKAEYMIPSLTTTATEAPQYFSEIQTASSNFSWLLCDLKLLLHKVIVLRHQRCTQTYRKQALKVMLYIYIAFILRYNRILLLSIVDSLHQLIC